MKRVQATMRSVGQFLKSRSREVLRLPDKGRRSALRYLVSLDSADDAVDSDDAARGFIHGYQVALTEIAVRFPEIQKEVYAASQRGPRDYAGEIILAMVREGLGTAKIRERLTDDADGVSKQYGITVQKKQNGSIVCGPADDAQAFDLNNLRSRVSRYKKQIS